MHDFIYYYYYYYYYYYCCYYYYLLQLSFHSVAVVLTLEKAKQIRINIHKGNNTKHIKHKYTYYQNTHTLQNPHYTHAHTHTLQNKLKQPQYTVLLFVISHFKFRRIKKLSKAAKGAL
jgi:hypothetical protein